MINTGKSQVAIPVVLRDGRTVCYACFNDLAADGQAQPAYWMPDHPDNYPTNCEHCGLTCLFDKFRLEVPQCIL